MDSSTDLIFRLRSRAEIRRQIPERKSVQEGKPYRMADLLEEAAVALEKLTDAPVVGNYVNDPEYLEMRLRMKLTGTACPTDEVWSVALKKLLADLATDCQI